MNHTELTTWLTERVAYYLHTPAEDIDIDVPFTTLGLDSVNLICIAAEIERKLPGQGTDPMLPWNHPTITAMATHLAGDGHASSGVSELSTTDQVSTALFLGACATTPEPA